MKSILAVATTISAMFQLTCITHAAGKDAWPGYNWSERPFEYCPGKPGPDGQCLALNRKWDDGKRQHIGFYYRIDDNTGVIKIKHRLYNMERFDGDTVCFTALWLDESGESVFAFHQRWGINARGGSKKAKIREQDFENQLPPEVWKKVKTVAMGHLQCQKRDDQAIWNVVITAAAAACTAYTGDAATCSKAASVAVGQNSTQ